MSFFYFLWGALFLDFAKGNPPSFLYSANLSEVAVQDNCPPFETVVNGNVEFKGFNMGPTAAIITCHHNYSLTGRSIIYCDDGIWRLGFDETFPKCVKRCPPPPFLERGKVTLEKIFDDVYSPTNTYLKGTIAKYTCIEGYILVPSSSSARVCENGYWTGTDAFCKANMEITCTSPPIIENGYMQPSFPIDYSLIAIGQEVVYECGKGYKLVGSDKIKCTDQGVWVPKAPSCHKETVMPMGRCSLGGESTVPLNKPCPVNILCN